MSTRAVQMSSWMMGWAEFSSCLFRSETHRNIHTEYPMTESSDTLRFNSIQQFYLYGAKSQWQSPQVALYYEPPSGHPCELHILPCVVFFQ